MSGLAPEHDAAARKLRAALAEYKRSEDLIHLGAYVAGSNPVLDTALRARPELLTFLQQKMDEPSSLGQTLEKLSTVVGLLK